MEVSGDTLNREVDFVDGDFNGDMYTYDKDN